VGLLRPEELPRYARTGRTAPGPALSPWVEWYWSVGWDLPDGVSYRSEVLPHPCVNLAVEWGSGDRHGLALPAVLVHGVVPRRFTIDLTGAGGVVGVKFRPGGFAAFTGRDVGATRGRVVDLAAYTEPASAAALRDAVVEAPHGTRPALLDAYLLDRVPAPDLRYDRVSAIVADMLADRSLTTVEQVTRRHDIPLRSLQRLFRHYVGVGPKWVLQRYRLHDAVTLLDAGTEVDLADLAAGLGWYDQAHFTRDFTALVGVPPARYAARAG
jgi:AraC-like DNA-binding protein